MPNRRTGIRTNRDADGNSNPENFPFIKGDPIVCNNGETGEKIEGRYSRMTKDRSRIAVVVNDLNRERWIDLCDFVISRDV